MPKRNQHQGKLYNVRINLTLPGKELIVNRNAEEDLYVSIRDAFDDMARQVEEVMRMREGQIKSHPNYCRVKLSVFSKKMILVL